MTPRLPVVPGHKIIGLLLFTLPCAGLGLLLVSAQWLWAAGWGLLFFAAVSAPVYIGRRLPFFRYLALTAANMTLVAAMISIGLIADMLHALGGHFTVAGTLSFLAAWLVAYHTLRLLARYCIHLYPEFDESGIATPSRR